MAISKAKTFISISFVIFLVVLLHYIKILSPLENFVMSLVNPGIKVAYDFSIKINKDEFKNVDDLKNAYSNLQNDFLRQKVDIVKFKLLEEENKQLREQLNFLNKNKYQFTIAEVIGKDLDQQSSVVIIDKGEVDGVKMNSPVVVNDGVLVGIVSKVEKNISTVRLINDVQNKVAATILGQQKSLGIVEGGFGISIRMSFVPQTEVISVGDQVISSGLESNIPSGLLIGEIEAVEKEPYQPFQQAVIRPTTDLDKINFVSILQYEKNT